MSRIHHVKEINLHLEVNDPKFRFKRTQFHSSEILNSDAKDTTLTSDGVEKTKLLCPGTNIPDIQEKKIRCPRNEFLISKKNVNIPHNQKQDVKKTKIRCQERFGLSKC
jgi:hypothetical protein